MIEKEIFKENLTSLMCLATNYPMEKSVAIDKALSHVQILCDSPGVTLNPILLVSEMTRALKSSFSYGDNPEDKGLVLCQLKSMTALRGLYVPLIIQSLQQAFESICPASKAGNGPSNFFPQPGRNCSTVSSAHVVPVF